MKELDMRALFSMTYGMYIVSTALDGKMNGQIANTVMQITADPISVATCLNKENLTADMVCKSGKFSVSILEQDVPMIFIGKFGFRSGRDIDKFSETSFVMSESGMPLIRDWTVAAFDAEVVKTVETPTHFLFIGNLISTEYFNKDATVLTYADYHKIKKGKSPKTAPTFGFNNLV